VFDITPIQKGVAQSWKIEDSEGKLVLRSRFGTLTYGMRPEGYDSWVFKSIGGAVTIPFVLFQGGELFVGLIEEYRANLGGTTLCAIGGMLEIGESFEEAGTREASEEAGITKGQRVPLGKPTVTDRLFWVFDPDTGAGGNQAYALDMSSAKLEPCLYQSSAALQYQLETMKGTESRRIIFLPWRDAVHATPDGIALAAIARLLALVGAGD
jgi:8-oxo-dGTP pyrophosphatase MutT (NUDIX family)